MKTLTMLLTSLVLIGMGATVAKADPNWSGFYVGAHAGYAWGDATTHDDPADWGTDPKYIGPFPFDIDGAFGGGTIGYNFRYSSLVFGPEADLGYMDLSGSRTSESSNPIYHQDHSVDGGFYAVLGGRVGMTFGETLIYGKGGWAYFDGEAAQTTTAPGYVTNGSGALRGWAYGAGIEQAIGGGWSLKAEYLHLDFDTESGNQTSVSDPPIGHVYENWTDLDADMIKVGVNYRFGGN